MSKRRHKRKKQRRGEWRAAAAAAPQHDPEKGTSAAPSRRWPVIAVIVAVVTVVTVAVAWYVVQRPCDGIDTSHWSIPNPDTSEMGPPVARSIASARDAVTNQPDSAAAWGHLGAVFDAHKIYDLATVCYQHAQELDRTDFRWPYLLGVMYDYQGEDLDKIIDSFEMAIRLNPESFAVYFRYGGALMRQGTLDRAKDALAKVLDLKPDLALAHRSLGQIYLAMNDPSSAVRHLERAAEQSPKDPIVFTTLARAYKRIGNEDGAARAAQTSEAVKGNSILSDPVRATVENLAVDPSTCARRAEALMRRGEFSKAIRYWKLFEESSPNNPNAHFQLGMAYLKVEKPDLAVTHLAKAVALDDDLVPARLQLASLYQNRGQPSRAIEQLNNVLTYEPDNGRAHAMLAFALGSTGDLDGAVIEFARAANLMPLNAELYYYWGNALEKLGRGVEALTRYRRAVQLQPGHRAAKRLAELGG